MEGDCDKEFTGGITDTAGSPFTMYVFEKSSTRKVPLSEGRMISASSDEHSEKKTQVFWPYQEKKQYLDDSIKKKVRRQETKRAAAEQLDGRHQGVDLPASLHLHQPSC